MVPGGLSKVRSVVVFAPDLSFASASSICMFVLCVGIVGACSFLQRCHMAARASLAHACRFTQASAMFCKGRTLTAGFMHFVSLLWREVSSRTPRRLHATVVVSRFRISAVPSHHPPKRLRWCKGRGSFPHNVVALPFLTVVVRRVRRACRSASVYAVRSFHGKHCTHQPLTSTQTILSQHNSENYQWTTHAYPLHQL